MRVECGHEKLVAQHRKAAVYHAATGLDLFRQMTLVTPDRPAVRASKAKARYLAGAVKNASTTKASSRTVRVKRSETPTAPPDGEHWMH